MGKLTEYGSFTLRIDMTDFDDLPAYATYKGFSIGPGDGYIMLFDQDSFFGDAGDCFNAYHGSYNMKFTTRDKDQDVHTGVNCAISYTGAWWYEACHCANLNGLYLAGENEMPAQGMTWETFRGQHYSFKTTQM